MTDLGYGGHHQPEWMKHLRQGSVIHSEKEGFRVVRNTHHYPNGNLRSVAVTIKRCSWTGACYTILNFTDLRIRGFKATGVRVKLDTELDEKIFWDSIGGGWTERKLQCCDVRGIA